MPDERTNSTITWLNSAIHGNQKAQTLIDMIQIGQWYGKHQVSATVKKPSYHPVVKFHKLDKDTLTRLQVKNDSDESLNAELDNEKTEGGDEGETITGTPFVVSGLDWGRVRKLVPDLDPVHHPDPTHSGRVLLGVIRGTGRVRVSSWFCQ
jgi:hypothetical protein